MFARRSRLSGAGTLAVFALAALIPAGALQAQDNGKEPAVPQVYDWAADRDIPATTAWGQSVDVDGTRMILNWTTMEEYTSPLVDHLISDASVVSPSDHFGHPIGKPGVLHKVSEIYEYLDALAASSARVEFDRLGETEEGRNLALIKVGSEENLARLDEIKAAMNALADPRATSELEASRIIAETPAVYAFYAGLHSTETGPPEMVMEMAYRLAVSDHPVIQKIRDEAVVFIVPVAEPDGRDKVVDWHRRYNSEAYTREDRIPGPPYWGKYIFHDNNRDGLQQSARLTQELTQLFLEWKYPVGHDLHESVPYLYVSTGTGPYNPTIDAIAVNEWQWMSNWETTQLASLGMPGVWTHNFYTGWYPGYLLWVTNTRNSVGRFYETFGNSVPHTMERELGTRQTSTQWYRPNPPREKTNWSLRNNTNYMQTGALSAVQFVADNRETILTNFWNKSKNSLERGQTEAPYAWVVPAEQDRRADAAYMINLIQKQGIEVHRAAEDGEFGDVAVSEGDFVIRMDQPYRNFVQTLMERQDFPEDAPSPYDDVAWTYPLMFNVDAFQVDDMAVQDMDMDAVSGAVTLGTEIESPRRVGDDGLYAIAVNASAHSLAARLDLGGATVQVIEDWAEIDDDVTLAPGTWTIRMSEVSEDVMESFAGEWGFDVFKVRAEDLQGVPAHELDLPRVALLHTWSRTQDEGWARFSLDQQGFDYDYVGEDRIGEMGNLRNQYDLIIFPHQGTGNTAKRIMAGVDPSKGPIAYTRTAEYDSHGTPDSSNDITGGMGFEGLMALRDFVNEGGTLVTVGSASTIPVEMGFLRTVNMAQRGAATIPGSILQGEIQNHHNPLTYGYGETVPLYHQFGPYFQIPANQSDGVAVRYTRGGDMLLSGVARSAGNVGGQPAVYAEQVGDGWIVIYGFDALHRHQNLGNHALVWNAFLNWNDLGAGADMGDEVVAPEDGSGENPDEVQHWGNQNNH
jgi:hypothetical protein